MWKVIFALVWLFVESMGFPLLSEGAFGPLTAAVHTGKISLVGAYLFAYLVVIAGNAIGFFAFWHYGEALRAMLFRKWPSLGQKLEAAEPKIRARVFVAMGISRFVGLGTFGVVLWIAGAMRVSWKWFLPYLFVLDLIWTAIWLLASHAVVGAALNALRHLEMTEALLYGALAVVGYLVVTKLVKRLIRSFGSGAA